MLRAARIASAALLSFGVVLAATGWLYVIQPHSAVPGPPVTDALPLDELSRRSAVPLIVFLGVWAVAALSLALIARIMRAERLTAGLLLALGVGGWAYLQTGLSLLIVRQIPAHQASTPRPDRRRSIYRRRPRARRRVGGRAHDLPRPRSPLCWRGSSPPPGRSGSLTRSFRIVGQSSPHRARARARHPEAIRRAARTCSPPGRAWPCTQEAASPAVAVVLLRRSSRSICNTLRLRRDRDRPLPWCTASQRFRRTGDPDVHPGLRCALLLGGASSAIRSSLSG
jgi:hypothetical protein